MVKIIGNIGESIDKNPGHIELCVPDTSFELNVLLFASLKERVGKNQVKVQVTEETNVSTFLQNLFVQYPELKPFSHNLLISINQTYASPGQIIHPDDEIALFPPVSGG